MTNVTNKLVNSPQLCVDDSLAGIILCNPGLCLIPGHNVVIRRDVAKIKAASKVTLLSGGGSGHEPAHAGYVGPGMLTAAVAGPVFTSPPPCSILAAIRAVGQGNKAGTLVIVKNYTGDRLNFGLALERAKAEGFKVNMVIVGEDCALTSDDKTAGRRGLAGTIFIHKIAGALAEEGRELSYIVDIVTQVIKEMGTIGLCLSPCSVPGSAPSFTIGTDEMELGLGIHGEAGIRRMKLQSAKDAVKSMLDHMTCDKSATRMQINEDDRLALMVNNLGGTSGLELGIVAKEACMYLKETFDIDVKRVYCGTLMTSLEMAGVSLTLLKLNDARQAWLDAPTKAPAWVTPLQDPDPTMFVLPVYTPVYVENRRPFGETIDKGENRRPFGETIDKGAQDRLIQAISYACEALGNCEKQLNVMDSQSGDGDCGSTFKRGTDAILRQFSDDSTTQLTCNRPCMLALELATIVEKSMGGSSGALYSIMLSAASCSLAADTSPIGWSLALSCAIEAIKKYGGATLGDRTMLDALVPGHDVLWEALSRVCPMEAFGQCVSAAEEGAKKSVWLKARAGRASYVDPALLTQPDPGAHAVGIWMRASFEALKLSYKG